MHTRTIRFNTDGSATFIWDDQLCFMRNHGTLKITRASNVEPTPEGKWEADLSAVGGPKLGPFDLRGDAISSEIDWLNKNLIRS